MGGTWIPAFESCGGSQEGESWMEPWEGAATTGVEGGRIPEGVLKGGRSFHRESLEGEMCC